MPNRVIREGILRSWRVNALSEQAEVFYRRLMSVVDDYGRYEADPSVLRAGLYPLRINRVSDEDVLKWLGECTAGDEPLIELYAVKGIEYLTITGFHQRLRNMKSNCPAPTEVGLVTDTGRPDDGHETALGRLESNRIESESETESKAETPSAPIQFPQQKPVSELGIEGWDELVEEGARAGMSLDPDPTSDLCQKVWRYRDFQNRRHCIQGIIARRECGQYSADNPQYTPTLANYVEKNLWKQSLRPRSRGQPNKKQTPKWLEDMAEGKESANA